MLSEDLFAASRHALASEQSLRADIGCFMKRLKPGNSCLVGLGYLYEYIITSLYEYMLTHL